MPSDYRAIRSNNVQRYGTDIGRIGKMLLADRYTVRTHFIFELLQNAEDALARRTGWTGSRSVSFHLTERGLRVSHFGRPFDDRDVRGICGIAESTKDLTDIGRFGIGFKSVYAFTDRPEIHSGDEDFAIESFVWPVATPPLNRDAEETIIELPLNEDDHEGHDEIGAGLGRLGASALMFLRQIEEIHWSIEGGQSGLYLRQSDEVAPNVRRVTVIGQERDFDDVDQSWLVFSKRVDADDGRQVGHVEIAFALEKPERHDRETIQRLERSALVVFFPTELETHLGFLVQGPYRTTPSRDLIPYNDTWNQKLIAETASLLAEALRWLRDHDFLDTGVLRCMPLDPAKFSDDSMFAPIFAAVKQTLYDEPLLPRYETGYAPGASARLARTQELRELFTPQQLALLSGEREELAWLSPDITQDRTADLRRYLMQELDVAEVTPETIVPRLDKLFLEAQSDAWILQLYHFLNGQPALRRRFNELPLIRLEDGTHVVSHSDGRPQAFLPGAARTGFPTVRASVCATDVALAFLHSLGLTEPDPVDDVIDNLLPTYRAAKISVSDKEYEADIKRILAAFATDSKVRRDRLVSVLSETPFLQVRDSGDGQKWFAQPKLTYLATERLKRLFTGIKEIYLVDDSYACLRGEDIRELLEACGAVRYLRPDPVTSLSWDERQELRVQAGHEDTSGQNDHIADWMLRGLERLLEAMPDMAPEDRSTRAGYLWEELAHLEERRGKGVFVAEYTWTHYGSYRASFDPAFIRKLNAVPWIPDESGELQPPEFVLFNTLGWTPHPFVQSKIHFRPPVTEALAREVGIEPGVLYLLKRLGLTSEAELRDRLGLPDETAAPEDITSVVDALTSLLGEGGVAPTPPVPDPAASHPSSSAAGGYVGAESGASRGVRSGTTRGGASASSGAASTGAHGVPGAATGTGNGHSPEAGGTDTNPPAADDALSPEPGSANGRPFISYVAAHPEDDGADPDGLDHEARLALEERAISRILQSEPKLRRTPTHNPGFDLFEALSDGEPIRWVEVKAMTGGLDDRPVGLSHTQFAFAETRGEAYWLYVVEHANDESARIIRIQDPAGKARTFTFDHGWIAVAAEPIPLDAGGD